MRSPAVLDRELRVTINWAAILTFGLFWMWGLNGYGLHAKTYGYVLDASVLVFFVYFACNWGHPRWRSAVRLGVGPVALAIIAALVIVTWPHLRQDLWSDQLYHSSLAVRHAQLVIFAIKDKLPALWTQIEGFRAQYVIQAINIGVLLVFGAIFVLLPRLLKGRPYALALALTVALILARVLISGNDNLFRGVPSPVFFGANFAEDSHPLLRLAPLFLSSTVLGVTPFGFRAAGFLTYLGFLLFVYHALADRRRHVIAAFAVAAIGSLPILWHVSCLVEPSIWAALGTASVFAALYRSEDGKEIDLISLAAIAVVASLLRTPAFLAFIPVAIVTAWRWMRGELARADLVPLLALVAFCAFTAAVASARGTPATEEGNPLLRGLIAARENIPAVATAAIVGVFPLFFAGLALNSRTPFRAATAASFVAFFAACNLVYYGPVRDILWGVARYQAEIAVPLIVAGVVAFVIDAAQAEGPQAGLGRWLRQAFTCAVLACLIGVNAFTLATVDQRTFRPLTRPPPPNEPFKAEIEYPQKQVFAAIKDLGLQTRVYYVGVYYDGFAVVLQGYSLADFAAFAALNRAHRWVVDPNVVNADQRIQVVVVEPEAGAGIAEKLRQLGWTTHDVVHSRSKRRLQVLTR